MMGTHEVVLNACQLLFRRSCCADWYLGKDLARIGVDNGNMKSVGKTNAEIRLADTCRTEEYDE